MWQEIAVGVLVVGSAVYMGLRLRRAASGRSACEQGLCDGCVAFSGCQSRTPDHCPLPGDATADRQAPQQPPEA